MTPERYLGETWENIIFVFVNNIGKFYSKPLETAEIIRGMSMVDLKAFF